MAHQNNYFYAKFDFPGSGDSRLSLTGIYTNDLGVNVTFTCLRKHHDPTNNKYMTSISMSNTEENTKMYNKG